MNNNKQQEYDTLVLSGGGIKGISYVGALYELNEQGILGGITKFAGTSVGAMICGMLSVRLPLDQIKETAMKISSGFLFDISFVPFSDIYSFLNDYGLYSGDKLEMEYEKIIFEHTGIKEITFKQIKEIYGTEVTLVGACINKKKPYYLNVNTEPDMSLSRAVRISASVPGLFKPIIHKGDYLVDGGIIDNFPIHLFDKEKTIGIKFNIALAYERKIDGLTSYFLGMLETVYVQLNTVMINDDYHVITIMLDDAIGLNFDITADEKKEMIRIGNETTKKELELFYEYKGECV